MQKKQSELTVITKAKDLCTYVMIVTQKSPKQYRYTFVSRLQNLSLDIIENLYRAKDSFVSKGNKSSIDKRLEWHHWNCFVILLISPKIQDVFCLNNMSKYPRRVQNVCNILEPGLTVTERDYRYDALSGD